MPAVNEMHFSEVQPPSLNARLKSLPRYHCIQTLEYKHDPG
jgi:hypothetical protein